MPWSCCVMTAMTAPLPKPAELSWSTTALPVSMSPSPFLYLAIATPSSFQCDQVCARQVVPLGTVLVRVPGVVEVVVVPQPVNQDGTLRIIHPVLPGRDVIARPELGCLPRADRMLKARAPGYSAARPDRRAWTRPLRDVMQSGRTISPSPARTTRSSRLDMTSTSSPVRAAATHPSGHSMLRRSVTPSVRSGCASFSRVRSVPLSQYEP